jgi:hypothetical protein
MLLFYEYSVAAVMGVIKGQGSVITTKCIKTTNIQY